MRSAHFSHVAKLNHHEPGTQSERMSGCLSKQAHVQPDAQVCKRREAGDPIGNGTIQVVAGKIPASTHTDPSPNTRHRSK